MPQRMKFQSWCCAHKVGKAPLEAGFPKDTYSTPLVFLTALVTGDVTMQDWETWSEE